MNSDKSVSVYLYIYTYIYTIQGLGSRDEAGDDHQRLMQFLFLGPSLLILAK